MVLPQFLLPIPATWVGARSVSVRKENQMMEKKKIGNFGNAIAENGRKKKIVCGNGIAEIGGKKNFWNCEKWNGIQQCHCHNSIHLYLLLFFFLRNDKSTQFLQYFYNKF